MKSHLSSSPRIWQRLTTVAAILCAIALLLLEPAEARLSSTTERTLAAECEKTCQDPPLKDLQHFSGDDLMDPQKMLDRLKAQRQQWVNARLKKDYGPTNYLNLFEPLQEVFDPATNQTTTKRVAIGRNQIFKDPDMIPKSKKPEDEELPTEGVAWDRFVNKLKMKLLQIQLGILEERKNAKAICLDECAQSDESGTRFLKVPKSTGLYSKFTWATGGHSASAGHGNFFRESYTATMDRALTPIFQSIGLELEARNYAMGGTDSGEEVALCMNSIFGQDVDAISWDYGMTDGRPLEKITMYAYKAARISQIANSFSMPGKIGHRPAWFTIHQNVYHDHVMQAMHKLGMTALAFNNHLNGAVLATVPDMLGMSDAEIAKVPSHVQYLKCDGQIEVGDPGCKENKFNHTMCLKRQAQTSWHPGWKMHALVGNQMAMTFLDGLEDAIQSLMDDKAEAQVSSKETEQETKARLTKMLQALNEEERKRYDNIFKAPVPEELERVLENWYDTERREHLANVETEAVFKNPSFCHTAILPSEARFKGFFTENFTRTGDIWDQIYDTGVSSGTLEHMEHPGWREKREPVAYINPAGEGKMVLVNNDNARQDCEEYVNLDYKDYFQVSNLVGWQSLTIPNKSEKKQYHEFDAKTSKGYVLACMARCSWGKCKGGDLSPHFGWIEPKPRRGEEPPTAEELAKLSKMEITVNGERMTEASNMGTCYALRNKRGHVWKPNADGQYEIKVRIIGGEGYQYLRFSSFILI